MGIMTKLFGGKVDSTSGGDISGHNINKSGALAHTDSSVPSPHNADFSSIRTAPVVPKPRYFSINETNALKELAKQKQREHEQTLAAYVALKRIDRCDTGVHEAHRHYQGLLAQNELAKLKANAQLAEKLHAHRPEYEKLDQRVETADRAASNAINAIRQTYGA